MYDVVCLDTNIIVWGVKGISEPSQKGNIPKAEFLLRKLQEHQSKIIIPSIVLSELLVTVPPEKQPAFIEAIYKLGAVPQYGVREALYFAKFWRTKKETAKGAEISRREMKMDFMIIGTALAHGANCIYTHDIGLKKIAEDIIPVKGLSDLPPHQGELSL